MCAVSVQKIPEAASLESKLCLVAKLRIFVLTIEILVIIMIMMMMMIIIRCNTSIYMNKQL